MAPEILAIGEGEESSYGGKADMFSFGFILYEMAYGQHPFPKLINNGKLRPHASAAVQGSSSTVAGMALAISTGREIKFPPEGQKVRWSAVDALAQSCCKMDPALRPTAEAALALLEDMKDKPT